MTTDRSRTSAPSLSRGAFLGAAALALVGGGAGTAALAGAAAPADATVVAKKGASSAVKLPSRWRGTLFTAPLDGPSNGYLSSFTTLYGSGPITRISAKKLRESMGIVDFLPYDVKVQTEGFRPVTSKAAKLDGGPVQVTFVGDRGTRVRGSVRLVRTSDPHSRGLIVFVRGRRLANRSLPAGVPIVADVARIKTPSRLTPAMVREMVMNAVCLSFSEDGEMPHVTIDRIAIRDGGRHVTARIRGRVEGTRVDSTWYGTAVHGNSRNSWAYVFGKLPA